MASHHDFQESVQFFLRNIHLILTTNYVLVDDSRLTRSSWFINSTKSVELLDSHTCMNQPTFQTLKTDLCFHFF